MIERHVEYYLDSEQMTSIELVNHLLESSHVWLEEEEFSPERIWLVIFLGVLQQQSTSYLRAVSMARVYL